jgi:hypothetical protein
MAGIPLPALAIHGPDPAEMMNAFLGVGRLQQQAAGQLADFTLGQQQNAMAQQRLAMEEENHKLAMKQAAQAAQDQAALNAALSSSMNPDGSIDVNKAIGGIKPSYSGDLQAVSQHLAAYNEAIQKIKEADFKTTADKQGFLLNTLTPFAAQFPQALGVQMTRQYFNEYGDDADKKYIQGMPDDKLWQMIQARALMNEPITKVGPGQTLMQRDPTTGQLVTAGQGPAPPPKPPDIKTVVVDGKLRFAIPNPSGKGFLDYNTGEPITNGVPVTPYAQAVLPTKTITMINPKDQLEHRYQLDPSTGKYSIDLGAAPTGAVATQLAQAGKIIDAGNDLVAAINANKNKIGNVPAIIQSAFLGTPLADPAQSYLAAKISSFAALQPALHGFRGRDALKEFLKMIGGIPNNPDALIAAIRGISSAADVTVRQLRGESAAASGAVVLGAVKPGTFIVRTPGGQYLDFKNEEEWDKFRKARGIK